MKEKLKLKENKNSNAEILVCKILATCKQLIRLLVQFKYVNSGFWEISNSVNWLFEQFKSSKLLVEGSKRVISPGDW